MDITKTTKLFAGLGMLILTGGAFADGWDPKSNANSKPRDPIANTGGVGDTRHNMTMNYLRYGGSNDVGADMDEYRNDYGAVCVYCHTPHGANTQIDAPLWNRTVAPDSVYEPYDRPTTLMRPMSVPGPTSLTCLSCHDGTIAIDSVLNMPGSGRNPMNNSQNASRAAASNMDFLNQWAIAYPGTGASGKHATLGPDLGNSEISDTCAGCHNNSIFELESFRAFMIGTDLRNDHPVGVLYPDAAGVEAGFFNEPNVKLPGNMAFFDTNGNNRADLDEVRLYDSGEGYEVECASCHDPHGVPSGGSDTNTRFSPSFLRINNGIGDESHDGNINIVSNGPSALCLTCHTK